MLEIEEYAYSHTADLSVVTLPPLAVIGLIGFCAACSQWLAWKLRLPSILFLLISGILLGPVTGLLNPDVLLGDLLFPFVSVAVAIILFEGGLTLDLEQIRGHGSVVKKLLLLGVLITWGCMSLTVHWLFDIGLELAFLFGAIAVVTGPTVIKPLLRSVRPVKKISRVLHWEGVLIDPVGAFLAILVFEYILLSNNGDLLPQISLTLLKLVVIGVATGVFFGFGLSQVIIRRLLPDYLREALTLMVVVIAFVLAETIQHESGLLTVTIMGGWLANSKKTRTVEIAEFKESLSLLLLSGLFILLAARLQLDSIVSLGWPVLAFLFIAQFVIRPLCVVSCTLGEKWSWQEIALASWIAPRGIVAAAISSLFVIRLGDAGVEQAEILVPLAFILIIGTVVIQSLTAKSIGSRLGVTNPTPSGVLLVGSNPVSIALAQALRTEGISVVVADPSWVSISESRRAGLRTYHGNPTSGHAEQHLDLSGIGFALAVSGNPERNALVAAHFRDYFGSDRVFVLPQSGSGQQHESVESINSLNLFNDELSYEWLHKKFENQAAIRTLVVVEDEEIELHGMIPLFAIDSDGNLYVYNSEMPVESGVGWKILVLEERGQPKDRTDEYSVAVKR